MRIFFKIQLRLKIVKILLVFRPSHEVDHGLVQETCNNLQAYCIFTNVSRNSLEISKSSNVEDGICHRLLTVPIQSPAGPAENLSPKFRWIYKGQWSLQMEGKIQRNRKMQKIDNK